MRSHAGAWERGNEESRVARNPVKLGKINPVAKTGGKQSENLELIATGGLHKNFFRRFTAAIGTVGPENRLTFLSSWAITARRCLVGGCAILG